MENKKEIYYYDADGNATEDENEAFRGYICEYDNNGKLISETSFLTDKGYETEETNKEDQLTYDY